MQAIILAAGEGTRMRPLTLVRPKPLVEVAGKPLISHIAEALPEEVDELIVVVGYLSDQIREYCGDHFCGRPVRYITQHERLGTADALRQAEPHLRDKFFVLFGDDLLGPDGLARAAAHDLAILVHEHPEPQHFGVVVLNEDGTLKHLIEKPDEPPTNLISTGVMVLDRRIFDYQARLHEKGEYFLTDMVAELAGAHPIQVEHMDFWHPVGRPQDIGTAEAALLRRSAAVI